MTLQNRQSAANIKIPSGFELLHTLKSSEGSIFSLAWSPDGKTIAIGTTDSAIQLWDGQSGELRAILKHKSPVSTILWAPDGQMLATGLWNKSLYLWDARSGALSWTLEHSGIISSLTWNPDARIIAAGTGEKLVYLWNAKNGELLRILKGHEDGVICLAWSPDGRTLASGSDDQTIRLWDTPSGQLLRILKGQSGEIINVAWSVDGQILASGTINESIQLWQPQSGLLLQSFEGIYGNAETTVWSPNCPILVSGSKDKIIYVLNASPYLTPDFWKHLEESPLSAADIPLPQIELLQGHTHRILSLRFSPDGRLLASKSEDHTVRLWRCDTWETVSILPESSDPIFGGLSFHPHQRILATSDKTENTIRIWRLDFDFLLSDRDVQQSSPLFIEKKETRSKETRSEETPAATVEPESPSSLPEEPAPPGFTLIQTLYADGNVCEIDWGPHGNILAAAQTNHAIQRWEALQGKALPTLIGHEDPVYEVSWSPNGRWLASGSTDQTVRLWDGENGILLHTLEGHSNDVGSLTWSPDSTMLASGSRDQTVRLWNSQEGVLLRILEGHRGPIYDLDWSPDGKMLASASFDKTIRIWEIPGGQLIRTLEGHGGAVTSVAWSPDGHMIASGFLDNTIHLWNAQTGRQTGILEGHTDIVLCIRFSPDGRFLASKSYDGTIRLWRCDNWNVVALLQEPAQSLIFGGLAFHPSSPFLATLGPDTGEIRLWQLDYDALLQIEVHADVRYYRNAKVVLMGDTGVGKSGLALALTNQAFQATESTHGRRVWTFNLEEAALPDGQTETRETLLWDLAGQPGYRLIHQLHLNEVAVALMVIDSRSDQETFGGLQHWDRALQQAYQIHSDEDWPLKKFLVAARADRGGLSVSRQRLTNFLEKLGFNGFFETSAREGWQIPELQTAIKDAIQWEALPKVSSNELFQVIMQFLVDEKHAGRVLSNTKDLYQLFCRLHSKFAQDKELQAKFETCIARVETRGLIRRLNFGGYLLLQPELLDSYASGMINAAKTEVNGLGCLAEEDVLLCRFRMPADERIQDTNQEKLLVIATVEELLCHELALKEADATSSYLVFPSQITREYPHLNDIPGKSVIYTFEGAILNAYVALVVRLSRSAHFQKQEHWQNVATYAASTGGTCGLVLRTLEEGPGELTIFFEDNVDAIIRARFEAYIAAYLKRVALPNTVQRHPIITCPECGEQVPESILKRLRERGRTSMTCPICGMDISLEIEEKQVAEAHLLTEMDQAADDQRKRDTAAMVLRGKIETGDYDVFLCCLPQDTAQVSQIGDLLKKRGILPWLIAWEVSGGVSWQKSLEQSLDRIKAVAIFIGDSRSIPPWHNPDVLKILHRFRTQQRPVIPVNLPTSQTLPQFPDILQSTTWVDFRQAKPDPLDQLIARISGEREL
ncbi:WD-repeat protein [Candidatus Vecturithrix granuli]|uniref:WD-repeat protein n=1 Tax=Vecturithrix granuli TaxID=1499967 RepID=A0A081C1D7_VECG1|nr:WD-repeat protein [Candidatus Vecturithrix granuli]